MTDSNWVIGDTQFSTNQFLHPYGGSVYYGFARSTGLNFYESFLYRHDTRGQTVETLSLMYVLLWNSGFGAVECGGNYF
ncbi:MAG: DUF3943 domain-containing protein [Nitrospira sp.]